MNVQDCTVRYSWPVDDDVRQMLVEQNRGRRVRVRPHRVEIHSGGEWRQSGITVYIIGNGVRANGVDSTIEKRCVYSDSPDATADDNLASAQAWVQPYIEYVKRVELARYRVQPWSD